MVDGVVAVSESKSGRTTGSSGGDAEMLRYSDGSCSRRARQVVWCGSVVVVL